MSIKINVRDFPEIMKDNIIFNQIKTLFWLEEQLKIQRYCVNYIYKSINTYNKKIENMIYLIFQAIYGIFCRYECAAYM